jgi:hypothetical protein
MKSLVFAEGNSGAAKTLEVIERESAEPGVSSSTGDNVAKSFDELLAYGVGVLSGVSANVITEFLKPEIERLVKKHCLVCGSTEENLLFSPLKKQWYCLKCGSWLSDE